MNFDQNEVEHDAAFMCQKMAELLFSHPPGSNESEDETYCYELSVLLISLSPKFASL